MNQKLWALHSSRNTSFFGFAFVTQSSFELWTEFDQGQLPGCALLNAQLPVAIFKFFIMFKQGAPQIT